MASTTSSSAAEDRDRPWPGIGGKDGWTLHPIDRGLNIEAGGDAADLDGDGDLDLIFGEDYTGSKLYWWDPYPDYASGPGGPGARSSHPAGGTHHDQVFGDFDGDGTRRVRLLGPG